MSAPLPKSVKFWKPGTEAPGLSEDKAEATDSVGYIVPYNPHFALSIAQQRQRLPIFKNRGHILYLLEKYQVLVLVGETGCGKSTQVPQYLMEAGWGADGVIGVTLPRRVAAITVATRVAEEKGSVLGCDVGYCVRFNNATDPTLTKIKFLTDGMLIRELMRDPLLLKYSVVMVDEAHERSIHTDIIVGLLKKILKRRADLRVIVSSATLDAEAVRDFFNQDDSKGKSEEIATIITIEGRAFPVDVFYISSPVPDYVKATMETILKIHKHEKPGDILAFLTGQEEVERVCALVREAAESMQRVTMQLLVLPMYASLTAKEQLKVFQRTPEKTRKVVIATNIAEASITINGITYVIDCGFVKLRAFNPDTGSDCLVVVPVSQASAEQRSGRAGRVRSGKSYRLYPEEEHAKLPAATVPEMQRSDLSTVLLLLKALGVSNVLRFNFLSKPPAQNMSRALDLLYALGAIDVDGKLTEQLGQQMAEFPLEPMFAKMLLESGKFECSEEILSIAAMLNIECVFTTPSIGKAKADRAKYQFSVEEGDHLTLLNVYESFIKKKKSARWCHENYLNYKGLMRVVDVRNQLKGLLQRFEIPLVSAEGDADRICRCIAAGFFANAARLHYTGEYRTVKDDLPIHVHPSSVLYALKPAQWVMFNEVLLTSRAYMRNVTAIDPRWLYELAPHYYQYGTEREIAAKRMKTGT